MMDGRRWIWGGPVPGLRRTGIRTHEVGRRGLRAIHCAGRLWDAAQVAIDAGVCCVASLMSCDERMDGKVGRKPTSSTWPILVAHTSCSTSSHRQVHGYTSSSFFYGSSRANVLPSIASPTVVVLTIYMAGVLMPSIPGGLPGRSNIEDAWLVTATKLGIFIPFRVRRLSTAAAIPWIHWQMNSSLALELNSSHRGHGFGRSTIILPQLVRIIMKPAVSAVSIQLGQGCPSAPSTVCCWRPITPT